MNTLLCMKKGAEFPIAPLPKARQHVFLGVDMSNLLRPDAQTGEDRTLVPVTTGSENAHVVCPGWVMSSMVVLPKETGKVPLCWVSRV